jgi:hypothetical protein
MEPIEPIQDMLKEAPAKPTGGAIARLLARTTTDQGGQGGKIRRRRFKLTIAPEICENGIFDEPFTLILTSPSSSDEYAAISRAEGDGIRLGFELVKACLVSLNGEPLSDMDLSRDALWDALGFTGRNLVMLKWKEMNNPGEEATKKFEESAVLI